MPYRLDREGLKYVAVFKEVLPKQVPNIGLGPLILGMKYFVDIKKI